MGPADASSKGREESSGTNGNPLNAFASEIQALAGGGEETFPAGSVASLFDAYRKIRAEDETFDKDAFEEELTELLKDTITRTEQVSSTTSDHHALGAVLLLIKADLHDVCFQGIIEFVDTFHPKASAFLEGLRDTLSQLVHEWRVLLEDQFSSNLEVQQRMQWDVDKAEDSTAQLLSAANRLERERSSLAAEKDALELEVDLLRAEVKELRRAGAAEAGERRQVSFDGEGEGEVVPTPQATSRAHDPSSPPTGASAAASARAQHDPEDKGSGGGGGDDGGTKGSWRGGNVALQRGGGWAEGPPPPDRAPPVSSSRGTGASSRGGRVGGEGDMEGGGRPEPPPLTRPLRGDPPQHHPARLPAGISGARQLTLKQLRDIMYDIYDSKSRADERMAKGGLPRETMEQHLYTYLNQKYGMRKLILAWAAGILRAVDKYAPHDCEVATFGKVLRNEVEEEFRFELRQLSEAAVEGLRMALRPRYGARGERELSDQLMRRVDGHLSRDEYAKVVGAIYSEEESALLLSRVDAAALADAELGPDGSPGGGGGGGGASAGGGYPGGRGGQGASPGEDGGGSGGRGRGGGGGGGLRFSRMLQVLLFRCLEVHEQLLAPVVDAFRRVDETKQGVLTGEQFPRFCLELSPDVSEGEVATLLRLLDAPCTGKVTFSSVICLLGRELSTIVSRPGA